MDHFYERHILHSLAIAKIVSFKPNTRVLDIGTGGGFPGIPLAILFPQVSFFLADSIGKKITVVKDVVKELALTNVEAETIRAENAPGTFDFVVSRAVAPFTEMYHWTCKKIHIRHKNDLPNGFLFLKGGDLDQELINYKANIQLFPISKYFPHVFFETKKIVYYPV